MEDYRRFIMTTKNGCNKESWHERHGRKKKCSRFCRCRYMEMLHNSSLIERAHEASSEIHL